MTFYACVHSRTWSGIDDVYGFSCGDVSALSFAISFCVCLTVTLLLFEIRAFLTLDFAFTSVSLLDLELIVLLLEPALTSIVTTVGFDKQFICSLFGAMLTYVKLMQ